MFTTIEQVKELTNVDVPQETIIMAQNIIEAFVGRDEIEVIHPNDKALLGKATAYQAAYMFGDEAKVFEQAAVTQTTQFGQAISYRGDGSSPWIAPLAVIACQRLSWKRMRSVKTGSIFYHAPVVEGWRYE